MAVQVQRRLSDAMGCQRRRLCQVSTGISVRPLGGISDPGLFSALNTGTSRFLVEPFGSRRFENIFTLDLQVEKAVDFGQYGRLNLSANFFNVTNSNTVIRRQRDVNASSLNAITELISPMAVRLGVRYSF